MPNPLKGKSALPVLLPKRLLMACVLLPICLALLAIFSTTLPANIQNQPVMGIPVVLWFWVIVAFIVCLLTIFFALGISTADNNGGEND